MKKSKMTIYMYSPLQKTGIALGVVFFTFFLVWSIIKIEEIPWWVILIYLFFDCLFLGSFYLAFRKRIELDEELGILKLYDFHLRKIPVKEIKKIEKEKAHSSKGTVYYIVKVICSGNVVEKIEVEAPRQGSKRWNYINNGLTLLNRRINIAKGLDKCD